ncbi:MAG: hypothetical protein ACI4OB_06855 [Christensenellales bacterium]
MTDDKQKMIAFIETAMLFIESDHPDCLYSYILGGALAVKDELNETSKERLEKLIERTL